mgnify:FL=1
MKLSVEQIQERIQYIRDHVDKYNTKERASNLHKMYDHFEERMMLAPGSSIDFYHNAWPGGYVDHIMNITEAGKKLYKVYEDFGMKMTYGVEEVVFCTMHHDLGKLGNMNDDYYIPNDSEWHRINQGKMYKTNQRLHFMTVTDRAVYLMSQFDIKYTEQEYLGLRLADGMYEEANKQYFTSFGEEKHLKTNLPQLVHNADMLATRMEKERYMFGPDANIPYSDIMEIKEDLPGGGVEIPENNERMDIIGQNGNDGLHYDKVKKSKPKKAAPKKTEYSDKLFKELFGDKK